MTHSVWDQIRTFVQHHPIAMLSLLCTLLFLPGLTTLPPLDRDESRFAQATSQMLETRDFIDIRFQDAPRYKKPVGIYWMQAVTVSLFSDVETRAIWAYRLPSVFGALLAVLMTYWGARRLFDRETALIAAALLGSCVVLVAESTIAKTDAMLLGCIVTAQMTLAQLYRGARQGAATTHFTRPGSAALVFWVAMGVGILVKGPVILMVCGLTIMTLSLVDRDVAWLRRLQILPGIIIPALILLPWGSAIWQLTDGTFFIKAIGGDLGSKVVSGQESHGAPPGYFTALVMVGFWPGSLFLIPALWWAWLQRADKSILFCLAWLIPSWIVYEAIPTKLPHYTLPLYPALACLCAALIMHAVRENREAQTILNSKAALIGSALWLIATLALAGLISVFPLTRDMALSPVLVSTTVATLLLALWALKIMWRERQFTLVVIALCCASVGVMGALRVLTIPSVPDLNTSPRLAEAVHRHQDGPLPAIASSGYAEPSLAFLLGTETKLIAPQAAARYISQTPGSLAIVEQRKDKEFQNALASLGHQAQVLESLSGLNYSNGDEVQFNLYRVEP